MAKKNPWIAGLLNLITGGLGYVYNGKRMFFGFLIFVAVVLSVVWYFSSPISRFVMDNFWVGLSSALFMIAFAIDAYKEAK